LFGVLSLVAVLSGCDPKGSAGAIGAQPIGQSPTVVEIEGEVGPRELPGPGGVTPTIDPSVDPRRDPSPDTIDLQKTLPGIDHAPLPWTLRDPAAKDGCRCHLECGPRNDDGSKDCITICEGTGC
jgi:hypothetical protein